MHSHAQTQARKTRTNTYTHAHMHTYAHKHTYVRVRTHEYAHIYLHIHISRLIYERAMPPKCGINTSHIYASWLRNGPDDTYVVKGWGWCKRVSARGSVMVEVRGRVAFQQPV